MSGADEGVVIRPAEAADRDAVIAFTRDTWPELGGDYIPRVFDEWLATDGETQRTLVAELGGRAVGVCQGVLLTEHEAWAQGMRVDPEVRGRAISQKLTHGVFEWARKKGATVCRNMVFSWNAAGLGQSRATGFDPVTEFRWTHPEPDIEAEAELDVLSAPDAAWTCFRRSDAFDALCGLGLDDEETWALSELTRDRLRALAADDDAVITVADGEHTRGMTYRVRTFDRENEEGVNETWAEYGVGAWADDDALRSLAAAVAHDAAVEGADRTRILIPETPRHVSDAAYARLGLSDEPDFVLERELTRY